MQKKSRGSNGKRGVGAYTVLFSLLAVVILFPLLSEKLNCLCGAKVDGFFSGEVKVKANLDDS